MKKAYLALAMKVHPDRVPAAQKDKATEAFKDISAAYDILSDPKKRKIYDRYGEEGLTGGIPENAEEFAGGMPSGFTRSAGNGVQGATAAIVRVGARLQRPG